MNNDLKEKELKEAIDKAYKIAGHNAYFSNGFKMGLQYAEAKDERKTQLNEWHEVELDGSSKKSIILFESNVALYGIDFKGDWWTKHDVHASFTDVDFYHEPTDPLKPLSELAVKMGYVEGAKVQVSGGAGYYISGHFHMRGDELLCGNIVILNNRGDWATIIEEEKTEDKEPSLADFKTIDIIEELASRAKSIDQPA